MLSLSWQWFWLWLFQNRFARTGKATVRSCKVILSRQKALFIMRWTAPSGNMAWRCDTNRWKPHCVIYSKSQPWWPAIIIFFSKQCSSFCWFRLLGPHTYLTSNITLERLRPHKCKWTDVMTLTGIFIQRMFPETQLWSGGRLIDLSHISLSYKIKAPPPLHATLPRPQGSEWVLLLVRPPSAGERTPLFSQCCQPGRHHMQGVATQCPNKSVHDTIVCPLTVIMMIIMDRLFCLQNTDGFNLTKDIPAEILRNWIIILLAVDLTLWLPKKNSVEVQGTEFLALCRYGCVVSHSACLAW